MQLLRNPASSMADSYGHVMSIHCYWYHAHSLPLACYAVSSLDTLLGT